MEELFEFMKEFVEIRDFGWNLLTFSFIATLFFTFLLGYAVIKQNQRIIRPPSGKPDGKSVSFIFFSYFGFSTLAVSVYGLHKYSLALTINGLVGFLALLVTVNLLRFKKVNLREKIMGFSSSVILPMIIFMRQKDILFFIFGLGVLASVFLQVYEIWKNKDSGSVHPAQGIVGIFSQSFWLIYAFLTDIWPMKIFNSVCLLLWILFLISYFKFKSVPLRPAVH